MMMVFMSGDFGQNRPPIPAQIRPIILVFFRTGFSNERD
jgi:hypothetical protein